DGNESDGDAPDEDPEPEVRSQAPPADERRGRERTQQTADPDGRVEEADAGRPRVEQLQRHDDDQDIEHSVDERLRREEPDEEAQAPLAGDRPETGEKL